MSHYISVLLFTLCCIFCTHIFASDQEESSPRPVNMLKSKIKALMAAQRLLKILKERNITCANFDLYCSEFIESSPNLKIQPEVYQTNCEKKLKPKVCPVSTNSSVSSKSSESSD